MIQEEILETTLIFRMPRGQHVLHTLLLFYAKAKSRHCLLAHHCC